ncbi:23S ribosomal RNA methyltransferase Erm [Streptomyces sp. NPDC057638]|uniref:23S ribosomal RNA methyltransferase Erm n=1 Tax=Streptomyces sp. NPDC057638 TaxID=3346190 RepID=UPI003687E488
MPAYRPGRHELGQNFLIDQNTIRSVVGLVAATDGPIIEIGPGDGALTLPLQRLGRRLTGVEIDGRLAGRLARRVVSPTEIVHRDFLRYPLPAGRHVLVGNLPFHQTTVMLRHVLHAPGWTEAVLVVQWEVARRRAGVGGATMMTAQWWPWFGFRLVERVPAAAFRPRPGVDAGVLTMTRRRQPLLPRTELRRYQGFVHAVFTGKGRGLAEIVAEVAGPGVRRGVHGWLRERRIGAMALPKSLTAEQWAELYRWAG